MSARTFPTLKAKPVMPLEVDGELVSGGVITSEQEGGYTLTRPRYTRQRRTWGVFNFLSLSSADEQALRTFLVSTLVNGALDFDISIKGVTYTVRLSDGVIKFKRSINGNSCDASFSVVEV